MEFFKLFEALNREKVKFLLCGGLAVNIYGIPRMTADIDILLDFNEDNLERFEKTVKLLLFQQSIPLSIKTFVSAEQRKKAVSENNLIAFSYYNSSSGYMNLDVLIDVPFEFNELWAKRTVKNYKTTEIPLVSIQDLIELKKYSNRLQDQKDISLLSKFIK